MLVINQAIEIPHLQNHLLCPMQCWLNGVHISELPKFLAEDPDESTHSLQVLTPLMMIVHCSFLWLWVEWPVTSLLGNPQLKNRRMKPHILTLIWRLKNPSEILNPLILLRWGFNSWFPGTSCVPYTNSKGTDDRWSLIHCSLLASQCCWCNRWQEFLYVTQVQLMCLKQHIQGWCG